MHFSHLILKTICDVAEDCRKLRLSREVRYLTKGHASGKSWSWDWKPNPMLLTIKQAPHPQPPKGSEVTLRVPALSKEWVVVVTEVQRNK